MSNIKCICMPQVYVDEELEEDIEELCEELGGELSPAPKVEVLRKAIKDLKERHGT